LLQFCAGEAVDSLYKQLREKNEQRKLSLEISYKAYTAARF